jgi:quercetin dioxygenase-like cupin family protein
MWTPKRLLAAPTAAGISRPRRRCTEACDGQPSRILNAGETFYEPPTAVHSVSRNPSTDKSAKIIVFMVADQKNPSTVADAP